jgi:hypothetical protein
MSAAPEPKRPPTPRGDLAGMAEALAEFAKSEFTQVQPAQPRIAVLVPCFNGDSRFSRSAAVG